MTPYLLALLPLGLLLVVLWPKPKRRLGSADYFLPRSEPRAYVARWTAEHGGKR